MCVRHAAAFAASQLRAQDDEHEMQTGHEAEVVWKFGTRKQQWASDIHVCMSEH